MGNTLTALAKNYKLPKTRIEMACKAWVRPMDDDLKEGWHDVSRGTDKAYHIPYCKKLWTLHLARYLLRSREFPWDDVNVVTEYISSLGSIKLKTAKIATHMFVNNGERKSKEEFQRFLTCMRIRVRRGGKKVRISPAVDEELFNEIFEEDFPAKFKRVVDFSSKEVQAERERQMNEDQSGIWDVNYSKDAALAAHINYNYFHYQGYWEPSPQFKIVNPKSKPMMLVTPPIAGSVHDIFTDYKNPWLIDDAVRGRRLDMLFYIFYLLPETMTLPMFRGGQTFFSYYFSHAFEDTPAPKEWEERMVLEELDKLGCDFNARNKDGKKAIESVVRDGTLKYLKRWGCTLSDRDENGESSLELNSKGFLNRSAIRRILGIGVDLLDPNPKEGWYWMPWVIHNEYYGRIGYKGFQSMVREVLSMSNRPEYASEIFQEILSRPDEQCIRNDGNDLLESVKAGNIQRVKVLLALGAKTDRTGPDGKTCLTYCSETGNLAMAVLLLKNFADPNVCNDDDENCFRIAVLHGQFDAANVFHRFGADIDAKASDGLTVTHIAYMQNSEPMLQFCLNEGCSVNIQNPDGLTVQTLAFLDGKDSLGELLQEKHHGDINITDKDGKNLATFAFRDRNIERLKYLAKRGINLELPYEGGRTFFMESIVQNDQEMCEALLEIGADINTRDESGCTPLTHAIQTGNRKLCQFLLDKGCDPNVEANSRTPLMAALDKLDYDIASLLLDHKADINGTDSDHRTALLRCVSAKDFQRKTFDFLLSHNCEIDNWLDSNRRCALSILLQKGRDEEARILLERGVKVSYPHSGEQEPIVIALRRNDHGHWFHELIKYGVNAMNAEVPILNEYLDKDYFSLDVLKELDPYNLAIGCPLQVAMERGRDDVVQHLIDRVSDGMLEEATRSRDSQGRTPLLQAIYCNSDYFVSIFCKKKYNCRGKDSAGLCPISLAAKMENKVLTSDLYLIVGPKGAATTDNHGRSALTYAANNGWERLCDDWFIDDISLDCNDDRNGIIQHYRKLLRRKNEVIADIKKMMFGPNSELRDAKRKLAKKEKDKELNLQRARAWAGKPAGDNRRKDADNDQKKITECRAAISACESVIREIERRVDRVERLTRRDLLRGFEYHELLNKNTLPKIPHAWKNPL